MILTDPSKADLKIKSLILKNISNVIKKKNYVLGDNVEKFEKEFSNFCGSKYAVGVNSGTDALIISLMSLKIKPGDEIILPSHSASGTATAVVAVGAKPIFADIDPKTFLIDINDVKKKITKKTKVIIPVHIYGQSCEIDTLLNLSKSKKIKIVEDCAQGHGTKFKNTHVGNFGSTGCFSFYPTKNLGAIGDGGCVITNNKKLYERLKILRNFGWEKKFDSSIIGLNSRLDEIQASILRIKLRRLNSYNNYRKNIAKKYSKFLSKNTHIDLPTLSKNSNHTYHQYVIKVSKKNRNKLIEYCKNKQVILGIHYPIPLHKQKAFIMKKYFLPHVEKISKEIISLPIFPYLKINDQMKIINLIIKFFKK